MRVFRSARHINFADCDPAQIVFYPRFFEMFDRCTENMFRDVGFVWEVAQATTSFVGMPLIEVSAKFHRPVRFGDTVEIETWIEEIKGKVYVVLHKIINKGVLSLEGREVRCYAVKAPEHPSGIKASPLPADLVDRLALKEPA
jgi:4-hydroxybenzoyl-CoA thioesterase